MRWFWLFVNIFVLKKKEKKEEEVIRKAKTLLKT